MKLPQIRERLFQFAVEDGREIANVKGEGLVLLRADTVVEDEDWVGLYQAFSDDILAKEAAELPHTIYESSYDRLGRFLGVQNELDMYHALTVLEQGRDARRQSWLRRMIFRDLGVTNEQPHPSSD